MESWRKVFRDGVAPELSTNALEALRRALAEDDPRLIQGATTSPPPGYGVSGWPVDGACLIGYCGWQGDEIGTVANVGEYFAQVCFKVDQRLCEPAACRWLLNWFDDAPRDEMRALLLPEVQLALAQRRESAACA